MLFPLCMLVDEAGEAVDGSNGEVDEALAHAAAVKKLSAEQVKSDKDLRKRLVEADDRLTRRITKELSGGSVVFDKSGKRLMRARRRQRQR